MRRDRFERRGLRLGAGRCLDDVGLRREPVVEKRGDDPGIRIEPEDLQHSPAGRSREVDPLGKGHFGQPSENVPVRGPPDLGMNPHVGRELGEIPPEKCRNQRKRFPAGCSGVSREHPPHRVEPARGAVGKDLVEGFPGEIAPPEEL